jgi:hypothetical protein
MRQFKNAATSWRLPNPYIQKPDLFTRCQATHAPARCVIHHVILPKRKESNRLHGPSIETRLFSNHKEQPAPTPQHNSPSNEATTVGRAVELLFPALAYMGTHVQRCLEPVSCVFETSDDERRPRRLLWGPAFLAMSGSACGAIVQCTLAYQAQPIPAQREGLAQVGTASPMRPAL